MLHCSSNCATADWATVGEPVETLELIRCSMSPAVIVGITGGNQLVKPCRSLQAITSKGRKAAKTEIVDRDDQIVGHPYRVTRWPSGESGHRATAYHSSSLHRERFTVVSGVVISIACTGADKELLVAASALDPSQVVCLSCVVLESRGLH